jgi:Leucine-rich repeat (LRR) protein
VTEPIKRRRWFRFSLRMLLVAVTVLCVWLGFKVNAARRQKDILGAILKSGGTVAYEKASLTVPDWLRSLFGDDLFYNPTSVFMNDCTFDESSFSQLGILNTVTSVTLVNVRIVSSKDGLRRSIQDSNLRALGKLSQLENLHLRNVEIEGFGLAPLADLQRLRSFDLVDNHVYPSAPDAIEHLSKMVNLEHLGLDGSNFDDGALDALAKLRNLSNLKVLSLNHTDISDTGLHYLAGFTKLSHVMLNDCKVSAEGIRELRKSLPNCQIHKTVGD